MANPYKHSFTIPNGSTTPTVGAYIAQMEIRSIQFPAAMTGATISFTGATISDKSGSNTEPGTYTAIVDSTGAAVTVTVTVGKIVTLSEAQRDALAGVHWVKIVSASSEGADRTVILGGRSLYT